MLYFLLLVPFSLLFSASVEGRDAQWLVSHVEKCIEMSQNESSSLKGNEGVLAILGFSSPKVRHLLNNLCSLQGTVYLEIGVWKGSTLIPALYGNRNSVLKAIAIDNWSEHGEFRGEFFDNLNHFLPQYSDFLTVYEQDCFTIDKSVFSLPVNIYFYDGHHSQIAQETAFTYFDEVLEDTFIAVIDDWNWEQVRTGTKIAFEKLQYEVLYECALPSDFNGDVTKWWNGVYVAVIHKKSRA